MSIILNVHPAGDTIGHPGGQPKKFCRSVTEGPEKGSAAFNGTGLQNKSFRDRAEISKA